MRELRAFLPPLALMGVIFLLSDQPRLDSGLGWADTVLRKLAHFGEYALLCALWWRALRTKLTGDVAIGLALAITTAYAASDEFHQSFVAGRHGTLIDWVIDTAGAVTAAILIRRFAPASKQVPA